LGDIAADKALLLTEQLRAEGLWVEMNHESTSIKSQMRKANRLKAQNVIVLGEDEISSGEVTIKNMAEGENIKCPLNVSDIVKIIRLIK
jgi:histidyl-tRNA synthetase